MMKTMKMMKMMFLLGAVMFVSRVSSSTDPLIVTDPAEVSNQTTAVLSCNLTAPTSPIKGSFWKKNGLEIEGSKKTSNQAYTELTLSKITAQAGGQYECVFDTEPQVSNIIQVKTPLHVSAHKHSEQGNERDRGVMVCHGYGYPLPTDWMWRKIQPDGSPFPIANATLDKYEIKTTPNKSSLAILDLDMEQDMGDYECVASSEMGVASDRIHLRVRSRLAALWPFLGIVAEVIILVTIIFIYEKRRTPDDITDDDDSGSAPLKSNSTNHKEKNVRQRNSN